MMTASRRALISGGRLLLSNPSSTVRAHVPKVGDARHTPVVILRTSLPAPRASPQLRPHHPHLLLSSRGAQRRRDLLFVAFSMLFSSANPASAEGTPENRPARQCWERLRPAPESASADDTRQAPICPLRLFPLQKSELMSSTRQRWTHSPLWMVLIGFTLRVLYILIAHSYRFRANDENFSFGWEIGRIAYSIATGHGFSSPFYGDTGPTAWAAPIYPYVVAGAFKLFGIYTHTASFALLTFNSLFSALTAWTVYRIAQRMFNETVAVWSGWIWTLLPYIAYWAVRWIWETSLSTFLLTLVILITLKMEGDNRYLDWVGFGAVWGFAALSNTAMGSFLPFSGLWLVYQLHKRHKTWFLQAVAQRPRLHRCPVSVAHPQRPRLSQTVHAPRQFRRRTALWQQRHRRRHMGRRRSSHPRCPRLPALQATGRSRLRRRNAETDRRLDQGPQGALCRSHLPSFRLFLERIAAPVEDQVSRADQELALPCHVCVGMVGTYSWRFGAVFTPSGSSPAF